MKTQEIMKEERQRQSQERGGKGKDEERVRREDAQRRKLGAVDECVCLGGEP